MHIGKFFLPPSLSHSLCLPVFDDIFNFKKREESAEYMYTKFNFTHLFTYLVLTKLRAITQERKPVIFHLKNKKKVEFINFIPIAKEMSFCFKMLYFEIQHPLNLFQFERIQLLIDIVLLNCLFTSTIGSPFIDIYISPFNCFRF